MLRLHGDAASTDHELIGANCHFAVTDPAAGAGVFLLTAFRELVAAHWRTSGKRPDTATLRESPFGKSGMSVSA